jgi:hypothetical protein
VAGSARGRGKNEQQGTGALRQRFPVELKGDEIMPIILWLLGVPLTLIILLLLFGVL